MRIDFDAIESDSEDIRFDTLLTIMQSIQCDGKIGRISVTSDYKIVTGKHAWYVLNWLRRYQPGDFAALLPDGKIDVVVLPDPDPDPDPELARRKRRWLDYLGVKHYIANGLTQYADIAHRLNLYCLNDEPQRAFICVCNQLSFLPGFVESELQKGVYDKNVKLKWSDIARLAHCQRREFADYPECNGPEFLEEYARLTS